MMTNPLGLDHWTATIVEKTPIVVFEAAYEVGPEHCRKCGVSADRLYRHGSKRVTYRDTQHGGKPAIIHADVRRYRCRECSETFMQELPDMDPKRMMTKRCVEFIEQEGIGRTFVDVARIIAATDDYESTVRSICTPYLMRRMAEYQPEAPMALGIDELMLDGEMRAIFTDLGDRKPIDLIPTHRKAAVAHWLSRLPRHKAISAVSIDMSTAYRDVVKAVMPQAIIIIDKFHVVRCANQALDQVRNRSRKASKSPRRNPWRGQRLLRMRAHRLNPALQMEVQGIKDNNPLVDDAHTCKEAFFRIWDMPNRQEAETEFLFWETMMPESVKPEFGKVAGMIKRWREEIFSYFDYPHLTNAYTENRNGIVKLANRMGRGYSFDVIRAKSLLAKPRAKTAECPTCEAVLPVESFKTKAGAGLPDDLAVCGTCHVRFHTQAIRRRRSEEHAVSTR